MSSHASSADPASACRSHHETGWNQNSAQFSRAIAPTNGSRRAMCARSCARTARSLSSGQVRQSSGRHHARPEQAREQRRGDCSGFEHPRLDEFERTGKTPAGKESDAEANEQEHQTGEIHAAGDPRPDRFAIRGRRRRARLCGGRPSRRWLTGSRERRVPGDRAPPSGQVQPRAPQPHGTQLPAA